MVIFCVSRYESWKNRGKTFELRKSVHPGQSKKKERHEKRFPPGNCRTPHPYQGMRSGFEAGDRDDSPSFPRFSTIFPRSEVKNGILAAAFEVEESSETQIQRGPVTSPSCNRPSITTYLRYRFPRHPSAFSGRPSAQDGRRHISSHSSSMEPKPSATSATSSSCTCRTTG